MSSVLRDLDGEGLDLIRGLDLAVGVGPGSTIEERHGLARDTVVLLAVTAGDDIHRPTALLRAHPTASQRPSRIN
jgi:hypothetical protein